MIAAMDAATLRQNGVRQAEGMRLQAANYRNQASGDRAQGRFALFSGLLNGVGDALSTASEVKKMGH